MLETGFRLINITAANRKHITALRCVLDITSCVNAFSNGHCLCLYRWRSTCIHNRYCGFPALVTVILDFSTLNGVCGASGVLVSDPVLRCDIKWWMRTD